MDIYKRIGEAVASLGKITSVLALTPEESKILHEGGFEFIGTVDINGTVVEIYSVECSSTEFSDSQEAFKELDDLLQRTFAPNESHMSPFSPHNPEFQPKLMTVQTSEYGDSHVVYKNDYFIQEWAERWKRT